MLAVPFQLSDLKDIVSGQTACPEIDFQNSKIKDQALLTYIYNLNLADVTVNLGGSSLQDRRNFFLSYMNHKTTVEVSNLLDTYLKFLLVLKGVQVHKDDAEEVNKNVIFTDEEIRQLLDTDNEVKDAVEHAAFVLDGIVVHIMLSLNQVNIDGDEEFGKVGILKDPNWVGHTWVNLFKKPAFNAYYYTVMPELRDLVYFPYQYSESIYKGRVLLDYLSESPWVTALMQVALKNLERPEKNDNRTPV
jgi:hypothetical protein